MSDDDFDDDRIERFLAEIRSKVAERGYTCVAVMGEPAFCYTVGGTDMAHGFEFIVLGLDRHSLNITGMSRRISPW